MNYVKQRGSMERESIKEVSRAWGISYLEAEIAGLLAVGGKYNLRECVEYAKVIISMIEVRQTKRTAGVKPRRAVKS